MQEIDGHQDWAGRTASTRRGIADVAAQVKAGQQLIVVHGGSGETNAISEQLGHPPRFRHGGVRLYESLTRSAKRWKFFAMVTSGKINTLLVEKLQKAGVNACGLSVWMPLAGAKRKDAIRIVENGSSACCDEYYTRQIETVNRQLLGMLLDAGYTPVIAPLAISPEGDASMWCGSRGGNGGGRRPG